MNKGTKDTKVLRIALDAMGGDFAPVNEVHGAIKACEEIFFDKNVEIVLVGDEKKIQTALQQFDYSKLNYSIVHADEIITMDDEPTVAVRKKNSSLYKGLELHSQGFVDAFVSAGNTGAVMSTATILLGRIKGVSRPTIGSFFPTQNSTPCFVLDVGANIDCKPKFLYEFAVMGSIQVNNMLGIDSPKVAILNIGEEKSKGSETLQETYRLLMDSNLNFIGNVEGRDILKGTADVVVCDGFTGNVILKFAESFLGFFKSKVISFSKQNVMNLGIAGFMKPFLKKIFMQFDYQEYGGVPLLGVDGVVIIGHGKSTPKAVQHMLKRAVEMVNNEINQKISQALSVDS
ncbi:MAG: phosphate acyltransferase PlsX [bacterium]